MTGWQRGAEDESGGGEYLMASVTASGYCRGTALSKASFTSCALFTIYSLKSKDGLDPLVEPFEWPLMEPLA